MSNLMLLTVKILNTVRIKQVYAINFYRKLYNIIQFEYNLKYFKISRPIVKILVFDLN